LRCASAIVAAVPELGLEVRAGVHTGECEIIDGKPGGLAVVVGARISSIGPWTLHEVVEVEARD
jgi:hypothetical protein